MLFQVYGEHAMFQWLGWVAVFACLILANEVARRSKAGGINVGEKAVVKPSAMVRKNVKGGEQV